jgi:hypothetical protein
MLTIRNDAQNQNRQAVGDDNKHVLKAFEIHKSIWLKNFLAPFAVTACFFCQGAGLRQTANSADALSAKSDAPSSCRSFHTS